MNGTQSSDDDLPEDLLVEAADWEVSIQVHSVKAEEKEVRSNGQAGHLRKLEPVETIANDLKLSASGSLRPEVPEVERVGASQIPQLSLSRRKQGPMDSAESRRTDSAKSTSKAESDNSEPRRADGARARRSSFKAMIGRIDSSGPVGGISVSDDERTTISSPGHRVGTPGASGRNLRSLSTDDVLDHTNSLSQSKMNRRGSNRANSTFKEDAKQSSSWKKVKTAINVMNMFTRATTKESTEVSSHKAPLTESGTQTEAKATKMAESPVVDFLQDVCNVTGWHYGEIWYRPLKKARMHRYAQSFKEYTHGMKNIVEGNVGFTLSGTSNTRRRSDAGAESPTAAATPRAGKPYENDKDEDDKLSNHLKFSGYHAVSRDFPDEEETRDELGLFIRQTKDVQYDKGEGFPGLAWQRKSLDWHDLIGLLLDDELAADPRVATAKKIFAVSVGIPVLEPNTGQLHAVLMIEGSPEQLLGSRFLPLLGSVSRRFGSLRIPSSLLRLVLAAA